ncbi:MAG: LysR family transcriptional regulator [Puniceicoccales bacterium]|jgi:DNA-binding transcriptional LysR family regulator|nr:LysR family transcriptional regulator [Puniceicoccales bacterium]
MHIENLKIFIDIIESESFSKAAKLNNITQSAVSQKLHALEHYFDVDLVDKTKKSLTLTGQGKTLLHHAKKIVSDYSSLRNELSDIKRKVKEKLSIGTTPTIGMYIIPPYIRDFLKSARSTEVQIMYLSNHEKIHKAVIDDIVDVGVIENDIQDSNIEKHTFCEEELVIISTKASKLYGNKEVNALELENMPFVKFSQNSPNRNVIDKILGTNNINIRTLTEFENIDLVKCAVEANLGPAIVPISSVYMELEKQIFHCSRIKNVKMPYLLSFFYKKDKYISSAMKIFFAMMRGDINFLHFTDIIENKNIKI